MKYSKMCLVVEINVRHGYILYNFPHSENVPSLSRNLHTEQCNLCYRSACYNAGTIFDSISSEPWEWKDLVMAENNQKPM